MHFRCIIYFNEEAPPFISLKIPSHCGTLRSRSTEDNDDWLSF